MTHKKCVEHTFQVFGALAIGKFQLQCRGTVVRSVWKRGRPVRPRFLRLWDRASRDRFCVPPNVVALRATVLALRTWGPL